MFFTAGRSILTNKGSHLLDVSFTTNLGGKFLRTSYHIIHNREGIFYLTRTKHECTSTQYICNRITNRRTSALPSANHSQGKLQNSVCSKIYVCVCVCAYIYPWIVVPCHHSMVRPLFRLQELPPTWKVAVTILNKQSRTTDKGCSSSSRVGRSANNSSK